MAFELIKKTTLSSASTTMFFTNIPQTFKDLKIFVTARGSYSGNRNTMDISFNSDTNTSNYKGYEWYYEDGAMGGEFNNSGSSASRNIGALPGTTGDSNQFGAVEIIIPNYTNTTNYKVAYTSIAAPRNASTGYSYWDRGNTWLSNNAINEITFRNNSGGGSNFDSQSTIWLYGLK
jgi:hypothetical protein